MHLVACVVGIASSAWMLRECSRGRPSLLKRQLFHQAGSTILINVLGSAVPILAFAAGHGDTGCIYTSALEKYSFSSSLAVSLHGLFFVSCLVEIHIAASLTATSCRASGLIRQLELSLPFIWPVAVVYSVSWSLTMRSAVHHDWAPVLILSCFVSTLVLYVAALQAAVRSHAPDVVSDRLKRRATVYPLIFMIVGFPTCARYLELFHICSAWGVWSIVLAHAQATLNSLACCALGGFPQESIGDQPRKPTAKSVGFREFVDVEDAVSNGSWRKSGRWRSDSIGVELEVELEQARAESSQATEVVEEAAGKATDAGEAPA